MADQTFYIGGVNVGVFDDQHLVIEPFSAALWRGFDQSDGMDIWCLTSTLMPDLRTVGVNGMDVNPNGAGHMPPDGCYDIWMVGNPTTGDLGFVLSLHSSYRDIIGSLPGYTSWRKLMFGVLVVGGKLVPCHVSNWPMPTIMFTQPVPQVAAILSPSSSWVTLDLSKLVPENARYAWYRCVFTGPPCNAYISANAGPQFAKLIAYNQIGSYSSIGCRIDGSQHGYAQLFGGGRMDVYLDGWSQTEVS